MRGKKQILIRKDHTGAFCGGSNVLFLDHYDYAGAHFTSY